MSTPIVPDTSSEETADPLPPHLFRQAVEQAALAISITDARANILYANAAFQRITGYPEAELIGRNQGILSYRVTPKLVYETLWAQIQRQRPWNGLLVNKRKDSARYLADVTITPVVGNQGITTHFLGMQRDVTEVHRLERQVQNQKKLIESVVDSAQVAIVLLDEKEHVLLDNHEYKKLVSDLGKEPALRILAELRSQLGDAFTHAHQKHLNISAREVCIELAKRPARWFSCAISWFEEQDIGADSFYEPQLRHYLLLTIQDISELKQQQEALRMNGLRTLLSEQERIQGLRETLAGAIYQLEGPLNMLSTATNLLERRLTSRPIAATENTGIIPVSALSEAIQKGREALETLRACIPIQSSGTWETVELNDLITDALKLATPNLLGASMVVDWQATSTPLSITGDAAQLFNLFKQLIDNAIEAVNEKRGGRRELRIVCTPKKDSIDLFIEDSGSGIAEENRYKVFQPFFTGKGASQQHLGLGLTMAQEIVTQHGGTIDIDPTFHNGCRVRLQLPRLAGEVHV